MKKKVVSGENADLVNEVLDLQRQVFHFVREKGQPDAWLELNLTIAQLKSLIFIFSEGVTNSKTLACVMKVTPPDVTRITDRLVEQGLISREENPENRRMLMLRATDKGKELLQGLREHGPEVLASTLQRMKREDLAVLREGLTALLQAAEVEKHQPAA